MLGKIQRQQCSGPPSASPLHQRPIAGKETIATEIKIGAIKHRPMPPVFVGAKSVAVSARRCPPGPGGFDVARTGHDRVAARIERHRINVIGQVRIGIERDPKAASHRKPSGSAGTRSAAMAEAASSSQSSKLTSDGRKLWE